MIRYLRTAYLAAIGGICAALTYTAIGILINSPDEPAIIREVVYMPAPTTTSTTSTTTTTTTTTVPPAPAKVTPTKSSLIRKIDEYAPGTSDRYSAVTLEAAGMMACQMWNAEAGISRMAVIREINTILGGDDLNTSAAISQAVLWTICPVTATFPFGPRETAEWR